MNAYLLSRRGMHATVSVMDSIIIRWFFMPIARFVEARSGRSPYAVARSLNMGAAVCVVSVVAIVFANAVNFLAWMMLAYLPVILLLLVSGNMTFSEMDRVRGSISDTLLVRGAWTPGTRFIMLLATGAVLTQCLGMVPFGTDDPNPVATRFLLGMFLAMTAALYFAACENFPPTDDTSLRSRTML